MSLSHVSFPLLRMFLCPLLLFTAIFVPSLRGQSEPFANDIAPQFTFQEYLEQGSARITGDETIYLVYKAPTLPSRLVVNASFSLTGMNLAGLNANTSFSLYGGNLMIDGRLGDDPTYTPAKKKVKIYLEGDLGTGYHQGNTGTMGFIELDWSNNQTLQVYMKLNDCTPDYYIVAADYEDLNDTNVNELNLTDLELIPRDPAGNFVDTIEFSFGNRYFANRMAYYSGSIRVDFRSGGVYPAEEEEFDLIQITGGIANPVCHLDSPSAGTEFDTATTTVSGRAVIETGIDLDTVALSVNGGDPIDATIDPVPLAGVPGAGYVTWNWTCVVPLSGGNNVIQAVAIDSDGAESVPVSVSVHRNKINPVVSIDTPSDGAVSVPSTIPVTGRVVLETGLTVGSLNVSLNGGAPVPVTISPAPLVGIPSDALDTWSWSATVELGTGANTITASATDQEGAPSNVASIEVLRPSSVTVSLPVVSGVGGTTPAGEPAGTYCSTIGVPAINDAGELAFKATLKGTGAATPALLAGVSPSVVVRKGEIAPGTGGATFSSFNDPLLNAAGAVAFVAKVTGAGVTSSNDWGLWSNGFGAGLALVAREGDVAAGADGAVLGGFTSIALESHDGVTGIAYVARLKGMGVVSANDTGLWSYDGITTRLLLREQMTLDLDGTPRVLASFKALVKTPVASGQGSALDDGCITALLTFSDRTTALVTLSADGGAPTLVALKGEQPPDYVAGAAFNSFLSPVQNTLGVPLFLSGLSRAPSSSNAGLFGAFGPDGDELVRVVSKGDPAPGIDGSVFASFRVAVVNADNLLAWKAKVAGPGTTADDRNGLWKWEANTAELVVRENDAATGTATGTVWDDFTELALCDGGQLLFIGKLTVGSGSPAVTKNDDLGLWAVDSGGIRHLIVREGTTTVETRTVKSFKALVAGTGSPGQARTRNAVGDIAYWAQFTDGTQGIVKVEVP